MKHWYVVHTQAAAEGKASANLALQRYQTFLPRYRKQRRHARHSTRTRQRRAHTLTWWSE